MFTIQMPANSEEGRDRQTIVKGQKAVFHKAATVSKFGKCL